MAPKMLPEREYVSDTVSYDPDTGVFRWRHRPMEDFPDKRTYTHWNQKYPGRLAGRLKEDGYWRLRLQRSHYSGHRIAWLLTYGEPVPAEIDHIDGDPGNNRIANLRAADRVTNCANSRTTKTNTSGVKGVRRHSCGRFQARIASNGKNLHLGLFATLEEATAARREAAERLHGKFARHE